MYLFIISFFNLDKQTHGSYISQCHPGLLAIFLFFFVCYGFGFIFLNLVCWFVETVHIFGLVFSVLNDGNFNTHFFCFLRSVYGPTFWLLVPLFQNFPKNLFTLNLVEKRNVQFQIALFWLFMFYLHSKNKTINVWQTIELTQVQTSDASLRINW